MALQVSGNNAGVIGRMFARQNVNEIYGRQKGVTETLDEKSADRLDRVDLSPLAPKPLDASLVEDASGAAAKLTSGKKLTSGEEDALREDRVFATVTTLMALGVDDESRLPGWPVGLPTPSREEMETAYRRISQRLKNVEGAVNPDVAQRGRSELIDKNRNADFAALATRATNLISAAVAS